MKKVLVLGNFWHGNWSQTIHKELLGLGHKSTHINVRYLPKFKNRLLEKANKYAHLNQLQNTIQKQIEGIEYDYCLVITPYDIPVKTYRLIKQKNIKLIGWWGDDPMAKGVIADTMHLFDKIFLVDRSWIYRAKFFNKNIEYLPHGFSPKNFFPNQKTIENDLVFIGDSSKGKMDGHLRAQTLKILHENNIKVSLYGDKHWNVLFPQYPFLKKIYKGIVNSPEKLNQIYNSSKIALNVHHSQLEEGTNQRTFEASGSGVFQVSDYKKVIEEEFGENIATYTNPNELLETVNFFLQNEKDRNEKAEKAHLIASANNTYKKRLATLFT